jgi:membrane-bound lytic murein transglycosylase D
LCIGFTLLIAPTGLGASEPEATVTHFPRPAALTPNVEFWKRVYTEFGVGDFVLHDRDNLAIIYAVVSVNDTDEHRAADAAKPEIQRLRAKYEEILTRLAQGLTPEELGPDATEVAQLRGYPCSPDLLLRAAGNIRVQQGLREKVEEGMHRARSLMPRILPILRRHNVPEELAALPMVESTFNPHARSKAGAVGLWQFISSTGKQYLKITRRQDDRRDPIRATEAAAQFLKHNYQALGSWPLAIIAYNHGRGGIRAARTAVGSSAIEEIIARYSGPRFGFASKNFYAEFLAAIEVVDPLLAQHRQGATRGRPPQRSPGQG